MCWAFNVREGDLEELYWRYSFRELRQQLRLKYGELAATQLCNYNTLVQVANQVMGGSSESRPSVDDDFDGASLEQTVSNLNAMLRG